MTTLEQQAREAWQHWGHYAGYHICTSCKRPSYCRAKAYGGWLCLPCHDQSSNA